jgi:hypothetical protein
MILAVHMMGCSLLMAEDCREIYFGKSCGGSMICGKRRIAYLLAWVHDWEVSDHAVSSAI